MHGKVLYFFLAGEIVRDFWQGWFDQGEQRLAEFLQDNPYPEYTEVVEEVVRETSKLKPGQPAPDFTLSDLQGQSVSLSDFKGQAVFLDFWASWCGPCIGAVPYLEETKQRTRDQKVVFLNIPLDPTDEWHQAVEEHGLTGVHVHSPCLAVPSSVIVSRHNIPQSASTNCRANEPSRVNAYTTRFTPKL